MPRRLIALIVLVLALATACATAGAPTSAPNPIAASGAVDAAKAEAGRGTAPADGIPSLFTPDRDLIITANVAMRSDDPWKTADAAKQIAQTLGGGVVNLSQGGSGTQRSATLTMRVPSSKFDDAIAALKRLDGEVVSSNVDAKDVTDQLVDLDARITTLRAEEARYLQLFASAKTVDEMLKVQLALTQLRTQIEQLAAQQKNTKDRVAFSNITLAVTPIATIPSEPFAKWDPARTFASATAALAALFRVMADVAIWILVFGWIPLVAVALTLAATRVRRAPAA